MVACRLFTPAASSLFNLFNQLFCSSFTLLISFSVLFQHGVFCIMASIMVAFQIVKSQNKGGSRFISYRDFCLWQQKLCIKQSFLKEINLNTFDLKGCLRRLLCLAPLCLAAGLGSLLYIMIKDEVQLKEMLIRFWRYAYIDCEWNLYKGDWLEKMFTTFTDIRKWDIDDDWLFHNVQYNRFKTYLDVDFLIKTTKIKKDVVRC